MLFSEARASVCKRRELHGAPLLESQVFWERFDKHLMVVSPICGGCADSRAAKLVGARSRQPLGLNIGHNLRRSQWLFKSGVAAHCRLDCEQIAWLGQGQTVSWATPQAKSISSFHGIADMYIGGAPVQVQVHLGEVLFIQQTCHGDPPMCSKPRRRSVDPSD